MFRIIMNDGWTEVVYTTLTEVYEYGVFLRCFTVLFFTFFHLLSHTVSFHLSSREWYIEA